MRVNWRVRAAEILLLLFLREKNIPVYIIKATDWLTVTWRWLEQRWNWILNNVQSSHYYISIVFLLKL